MTQTLVMFNAGEAPELSLEKLMQQLLDDFHPQVCNWRLCCA